MCQSFAPCLPCSCFNIAVKQQYWESGVCSVERLSPCVMFPARKAFKYLICSLPVSQFYPISYTGVFGDDASVISFSIQHFWQTEIPQRWLEGKRNPICCFHSVRVVGWYASVGRSVCRPPLTPLFQVSLYYDDIAGNSGWTSHSFASSGNRSCITWFEGFGCQ